MKELLLDGIRWLTKDDVYDAFFRAVGALCVAILALNTAVAQDQCPHLSGAPRRRVEQQERWLVSTLLQQQIAERSVVFGTLVQIEQCHFLTTGIIRDGDFAADGLHFIAHGHAYQSIVGRYHGTWTLAVAPDEPSAKMPKANLLELTRSKWTLLHRDKNGSRGVLATGRY
jgi:hypothetical protein